MFHNYAQVSKQLFFVWYEAVRDQKRKERKEGLKERPWCSG